MDYGCQIMEVVQQIILSRPFMNTCMYGLNNGIQSCYIYKKFYFLAGQLFVYPQLFVFIVPNSTMLEDITLLMQHKGVMYEKLCFVYIQLFILFNSKLRKFDHNHEEQNC